MSKVLVVVDMQNDFISGSLGTKEAQAIVPAVTAKIKEYQKNGDRVIYTYDTHEENYLETQEGRNLPVKHCIRGTDICVVSNVLGTKAWLPETPLTVDSSCCAGVTPESHEAALATMRSCQVNVI